MRIYPQLLSIILISFISCTTDSELISENENLRSENSILKDSIEKLVENYNPSYLFDTLSIDTNSGPLGCLYNDTLILEAEYVECGEWGGDKEWLKIYRIRDTTLCLFLHDSADCENYNYQTRYTRIDSSLHVIDRKDEAAVIRYLNELTKLAFLAQDPISNACGSFSAKVAAGDDNGQLFQFEASTLDWSFRWLEFMKLRDQLKN